jgi:hypothetical protein
MEAELLPNEYTVSGSAKFAEARKSLDRLTQSMRADGRNHEEAVHVIGGHLALSLGRLTYTNEDAEDNLI